MIWLRQFASRFTALFRKRQLEQELNDELREHIEMLIEENVRRGLRPEEARYAALHAFGGVEQTKETYRDQRGLPVLEDLWQDLRYGARMLAKNAGFTLAAVSITALGIGATCVVVSFAEAAVLRALPYRNPSGLILTGLTDVKDNPNWGEVPVPVFESWREHAKSIGAFAATGTLSSKTLAGGAEPAQVFDYRISESALDLLGVQPAAGRGFLPSDYRSGSPPVVLLSDALWRQLFGGRREAIGKAITLDGGAYTIVGVMPPGFLTPKTSAWESVCWTPLTIDAKQERDVKSRSLNVWGRLNAGVAPEKAKAVLGGLALPILNSGGASTDSDWRIGITPMMQEVSAQWRSILIVLFGAAALLLAIACANVANLLVARAASRQQEMAVRSAIGANRVRLLRQLLTESLLLAGMGGGLAILLAHWAIEIGSGILPRRLHTANFHTMGIDLRVLGAALVVSAVVGVTFGLAPALYASKVDLVESLKEGGAGASPRRRRLDTQSVLVLAEVALSLLLLSAAGLLLRSFLKLEGVEVGIDPQRVLAVRVLLPRYRYAAASNQIAAYQRLLETVNAVPGVESSGYVSPLPLDGIDGTFAIPAQPGMSNTGGARNLYGGFHSVSPGYFKTMGIPLLGGRMFTEQDTADSEKVIIVDKAFADRYWPGQNPVGKEIYSDVPPRKLAGRVIGEVDNVRDLSPASEPRPEVYNPFTQKLFAPFAGTLVVKTRGRETVAGAIERAVHSVDADAPISQIATMDDVLSRSLAEKRLYLIVVGVFALVALALAAAGIASTVSYAVSRRKREVGIRMALGASRPTIVALLVNHTLALVLVGITIGAAGALAVTRFLSSLLYSVQPTDPLTFIAVSLILVAVALAACYIPARRATKVDPMEALRYE